MNAIKRLWRALVERWRGPEELRGMPKGVSAYEQKRRIMQNRRRLRDD